MKKYLGDGVYVDFDGYQVSLAANSPDNVSVYLEPQVALNLIKYLSETYKWFDGLEQDGKETIIKLRLP